MVLHLTSVAKFNHFIRPRKYMIISEISTTSAIVKGVSSEPYGWPENSPKTPIPKWIKAGGFGPTTNLIKS